MEELMQYVWRHRLWIAADMRTNDGRPIAVIDVGLLNRDSGPDFFNAKIRIGDEMWCGNVEIHVRASDWYRHGHDRDRAYDTVVLHVVQFDDCPITVADGRVLPQVVMPCARDFAESYARFVNTPSNALACAPEIPKLSPVLVRDWLDSMAFERLHQKTDAINQRLTHTQNDWQQTAFITLSRALGAGINGDAFERVAQSLPLRLLHKHSDSHLALEAMIFGQAGLLDNPKENNPYVEHMRNEYRFLQTKFGLRPPEAIVWRMSRMRPHSFPHRRLAVLAHMVSGGFTLMQQILDCRNEEDAKKIFQFDLLGYWALNYNFSGANNAHPQALGAATVNMLIINVVAPLMMAYGEATDDTRLSDRAIDILEHLPGEKNHLTTDFVRAGIPNSNAFISQAMIQARREYCDVRKCLYCRLGHRLLAVKARQ